jgi:hypothetical protein
MRGKGKNKKKKSDDGLSFIQSIINSNKISVGEISDLSEIDHPLFSFKYLSDVSIKGCKDHSFLLNFILRLQKLCELGWNEIRSSHKHSYGMEPIPYNSIKPKDKLPSFVTREVELDVFRASGDNRVCRPSKR